MRLITQDAELKHRSGLSLPAPLFLALLVACILKPDSQRKIQFLLTAACCPDRIYHLELELLPERQCTVDTSHYNTGIHNRHANMLTHIYEQVCTSYTCVHALVMLVDEWK